MQPPPQLIALNWSVTSGTPATVHRIVTDRIVSRGDNHQTLTLSAVPEYEQVVWRFLKDSEELGEDEVDDVIEMEVEEGLEESIERAVSGVVDLLGLEKPSDEKMGEALRMAREYEPAKRVVTKKQAVKQSKAEKKKKETTPRYYGLLPELDLSEVLGGIMNSNTPVPESGRLFWEKLKDTARYTSLPHVTIVHTKERENEAELWDACDELMQAKPPLFEFSLSHLVWNDRVMALAVDDLKLIGESGGEEAADAFLKKLDDSVRHRLHITVGTKDPSIPPVEAKDMVKDWRAGKATETLALNGISAKGRVKGLTK